MRGRAADTGIGAGPLASVSSFALFSSLAMCKSEFRGKDSLALPLCFIFAVPFLLIRELPPSAYGDNDFWTTEAKRKKAVLRFSQTHHHFM